MNTLLAEKLNELSKEEIIDLCKAYDAYINEANEEDRYSDGWYPVCMAEFYDCDYESNSSATTDDSDGEKVSLSSPGYQLMIPVIRVCDKAYKDGRTVTHMVGTDRHDLLVVDNETKGIKYVNMQNCEGTGEDCSYEFVAGPDDFYGDLLIEFVSLSEYLEICKKEIERMDREEREFQESMRDFMDFLAENKGKTDAELKDMLRHS